MTREEAVEVAHQAGRANLAAHIGQLHDELDELHAKHGSTRVPHVPTPIAASWTPAEPVVAEAVAVAEPAQPAPEAPSKAALVLEHDPALDSPLTDEEIRDINAQAMAKAGVEVPDDETTAPEGEALGSSTKPDHPDAPKKTKKGWR